jgi:putative ABC transport system permease protein
MGLASFIAEQRTKEIGIRKVLGASVLKIIILLSRDFIIWVGVATLFAWPLAYLCVNQWLQGYAYRVNQTLSTFIAASILTALIAFITASYQAFSTAIKNPIETLKAE